MSINTTINKWLEKADPDYYTFFIKSWIPYNAWYMHNFYDEDASPKRTNDREIIDYIKGNSNYYKDKIRALLYGSDSESAYFKSLISELHYKLEGNPIPDFDNRISFTNVCIEDNAKKNGPETIKQTKFAVTGKHDTTPTLPKGSPKWIFEVVDFKGSTISRVSLMKCSLAELRRNMDFQRLDRMYQSTMEECLNEINPNKKTNIVIPPEKKGKSYKQPTNSIVINEQNNLYFTDDLDKVSRALIQILYDLRCKLFHGEIEPTDQFMGVYEKAFQIQRLLIKALK